ncbi:MAG: peptidoglycan-associated lipoprotein Pal [Pseudomonadota bacterium]
MKPSNLKMTAAIAAVLALGACASTPPEEPEPAPVVDTAPVAPPVTTAPTDTVDEAELAPVETGPTPGSIDDFRVNVGERVYFDLNGARLDADDAEILQRQAAWLQSYPDARILVAGNCDERGTREYNLALGESRAQTVKDYLVSQGVDPARVETISYGKERPIAAGSNEQAWALNRNGFTQVLSGAVG